MKTKEYNLFTTKNLKEDNINNIMIKAGIINKLSSGLYVIMPNGIRILNNIKNVIINKMTSIGMYEIYMPILQPKYFWVNSNRINLYKNEILSVNIKNKDYILSPTNEEEFVFIFDNIITSKKKFPIKIFQIQTKFRNEIRQNYGILRTNEFIMKDGYSMHKNIECLRNTYNDIYNIYIDIFNTLNIKFSIFKVNSGFIGGDISHEFCSVSYETNNIIKNDPEYSNFNNNNINIIKKKYIEIAHIFMIGNKYSYIFNKNKNNIFIGSYGIGITRLLYSIIEQNYDFKRGIILPTIITPFIVSIILINLTEETKEESFKIYKILLKNNIETLFNNDEKIHYGESIKNTELLGIPLILLISKKHIINKKIEMKIRKKNNIILIDICNIIRFIKENI